MVPERDTGPNKITPGSVNAVGNLRIPQNQSSVRYHGEYTNNDEHRLVASRQHHHVSVQELRMQRRINYFLCLYGSKDRKHETGTALLHVAEDSYKKESYL
ncbi:hypothetical protein NQ317_007835 [Molorchus minor]|uniref:Uncharacterized protein n=1 Tax=Molorchus minor TaxID=1323400 RepID=A0ABQ9K617_9CUCU|nr:hypothetical protein NQ317_007835 [Molorchus minor]